MVRRREKVLVALGSTALLGAIVGALVGYGQAGLQIAVGSLLSFCGR